MKKLLILAALLATSSLNAQVVSSGAQQVQGTSAVNRGNAVNVRLTDGAGNAVTSEVPTGTAGSPATDVVTVQGISGGTAQPISAASLPLPTGASTSALQTTTNTNLSTINTTLGSPFQAGGSIGNSSFAATQSGTWNITNVSGTVSLPTGASTAAKQPALGTAGTASADVISVQGVASMTPIITTPYSTSPWNYAATTSGIVNTTTAVTIKAAAGVSTRNYITSIQYDFQSLTTATEVAIRDGAAGTVLWRGFIPSGVAGLREVTFPVPLRSTANTLLEFLTLTASGAGAVYFNAQGYTGS